MASSYSYGVINRSARTFTIVNAESCYHCVDRLIDIKPPPPGEIRQKVEIFDYYEGIKTELYEDGPPYKTLWLTFSSDKESVVTSRFVCYDTSGQELDYVETEAHRREAMRMASFVLYCDGLCNEPKAYEDVVKKSACVRKEHDDDDDDEEVCAICLDEYKEDCVSGTLTCKHRFHDECIKNWLKRNNLGCPICRDDVFQYFS